MGLRLLAWFQREGRPKGGGRRAGAGTHRAGPRGPGAPAPGGRLRGRRGALVAVLAAAALAGLARLGPWPDPMPAAATVGFVWPEYPGELRVTDEAVLTRLVEALAEAPARVAAPGGAGGLDARRLYWRLRLEGRGEPLELMATRDLQLYDPAREALLSSPELKAVLAELTGRLHASFFGERVPWDQALRLFPVGGTAVLRDVETGLAFQVRRHRGDAHADVEPLSAEDTATLREIYGGEWSWKRRAVVATVDDRAIAASINGMPHGWGDLFENRFEGHFCLHFMGSRVHTTWRVDDGHQLMVLKAAGALAETLETSEPEELARWVMAAVNHRERATLRHASDGLDPGLQEALFSRLRTLFVWDTREVARDAVTARVRVEATVYYTAPDPDTPHRRSPVLAFHRPTEGGPWLLSFDSLAQLLQESPAPAGAGGGPGEELPALAELLEGGC